MKLSVTPEGAEDQGLGRRERISPTEIAQTMTVRGNQRPT